MVNFIVHTPEGKIISGGSCSTYYMAINQAILEANSISTIVAEGETTGNGDLFYMNYNGAEYVPMERPIVPAFAAGPAPLELGMTTLPAGTRVTAWNNAELPAETIDPADPIRLTLAGLYTVKIEPPFPYKTLEQKIEVTDA